MQRKLLSKMFFTGLLGAVLASFASCLIYYQVFSLQVRSDVSRLGQAYANMYELSGQQFSSLPDTMEDYRLTLIDTDGNVLSDSQAIGVLENHADRPEVQEALEKGVGSDERMSTTLSVKTFYEAILLSDGRVLRVSVDTASIYLVFLTALPWLALALVLLLILEFVLSETLTRSLVSPITKMGRHLEEIERFVPYPELKPLAEALAKDRDLRKGQEKFRREFTANVSHELKTPLTGISGYAEMMASGMVRDEDIPRFSERIHREASRMIALIQDIIMLSELESQPADLSLSPELENIDLAEIGEKTVERLLLQARNAYLTLTWEGEPVRIHGNAALLEELCENLTENAIRYNRPGGFVIVSTGTSGKKVFLRVKDNGIGIPKAEQSRVFERFYRVDKSRSKAKGGTGLGLSIVKHIVLLHQGEIQLESEPGVGTTVTVFFP